MGTNIRSELSCKNKHWINRHRYYELNHFCLQYPDWKRARSELDGFNSSGSVRIFEGKSGLLSSPTEHAAEARIYFTERIRMIEDAAAEASDCLGKYILIGVTEDLSYDKIKARLDIPCGKDLYYETYRRFFWILDKARK